jgi:polyadenylate-binding protein 2
MTDTTLNKNLKNFDFSSTFASDFAKDKLVKIILQNSDTTKKSELKTRDICFKKLPEISEKLVVQDLVQAVNNPISKSMISLMQWQFEVPEKVAEKVAEKVPGKVTEIINETVSGPISTPETEKIIVSSLEKSENTLKTPENTENPENTKSDSKTSIDTSVETAMSSLLDRLNAVQISENQQHQPGTMPPVFDVGDALTFEKFIKSEFSRWLRFERVPESDKASYLSAVFTDNEIADEVDAVVGLVEEGEILGFDEIVGKVEELIKVRKDQGEVVGWQVIDSAKSTPRTSIVEEDVKIEVKAEKLNGNMIEKGIDQKFNLMKEENKKISKNIKNKKNNKTSKNPENPKSWTEEMMEKFEKTAAPPKQDYTVDFPDLETKVKTLLSNQENLINHQVSESVDKLSKIPSLTEQIEVDSKSVYVGQVDYSCSAFEVEQHFRVCGEMTRVTILCDRWTSRPKGFAYVEFVDNLSVPVALGMDGSFLKGRCISVMPKRTHNPRVFAELSGQGKSQGGRSSFAGFGGAGRKKNSFFY